MSSVLFVLLHVNEFLGSGGGGLELHGGVGAVRGQKHPGRQSEMMRLRNKSVKNLDFLLFILFTCAGLAEKWVGRLN